MGERPPRILSEATPQPWKKTQTLTLKRWDGRANCGASARRARVCGRFNAAHDTMTSSGYRALRFIEPPGVAPGRDGRFPPGRRQWEKPLGRETHRDDVEGRSRGHASRGGGNAELRAREGTGQGEPRHAGEKTRHV